MEWRTQNAYNRDNEAHWRSLPWRQRYDWPLILAVLAWLAVVGSCIWAGARMWRM